jgi:hypothetical protein
LVQIEVVLLEYGMSVRALAVSMFLALGLAAQSAAARDLASLGAEEVRSLQQRLSG